MFLSAANPWNVVLFAGLAVFIAAVLTAYVYSLVWSYRDAKARGKSGLNVALLVALLKWPVGLVAWLVCRPQLSSDRVPGSSSRCT